MSFYKERILPHLVHLSMRQETFAVYRGRVVPAARGRVLEVGIGSGLNLGFYGEQVKQVIGLEPSAKLLSMAREAADGLRGRAELVEGSAEAIPLDDESINTVVTTWTLCSIPDVARALAEMRRVLRRHGTLLFVEHGRSPDPGVQRWQDRLTPLWKHIGGGCHLNRPVRELIEQAGFRVERIDTGYMKGPKPMTFMYEGAARRV
ncbi:MAG: class I SAM-dependent methyltransferase [Acidobacteria bacterium]|nr:class I SAM-dependent methyltransferase [Acidobacteriota bacterium]